ncbi:conserved Plasmodium protein, unknown function [Plasmodium vinckei brucechwatti]|uniref:Zinc finger protein n=1 Tax=Plasmodium vinckei brucechwatti TaxID=119398 RepID=A0A6V7SRV9_PLAVN|nr:conserved Plasmodium protein, unknown function [Plasmodium vinckei brucechwatti]
MFKSIVPTTVGLNNSNYVHANIDEEFNFYNNGNNNISNNFPKKEKAQIAIDHEQILNVSNSYNINIENLVNAKTPEEIALRILKSQNIQNKRKYTDNNNANYEINKKNCNLYDPNLCYINNSKLQANISSQNALNQKYSDQHYFKYNFSEHQFQNSIKEKWKRHSDNRVVYNTHGGSQNLYRSNNRTSNDSSSNNNSNYYNDFHHYYNNNCNSIYMNRPYITNESQFVNFQKIPNRAHNSVPLSQFNDPQNMNYIDSNIINQIDMIKFAYKKKFLSHKNMNNTKQAYDIDKSNYCNNIYLTQNDHKLGVWPNASNPPPNYTVPQNIHIEPYQNNDFLPILEPQKFEKKTDETATEIGDSNLMNINENSEIHKIVQNSNEQEDKNLEQIGELTNANDIVDKIAKIQTEDSHKIDTEKICETNNSITNENNKNDSNENKINNHNIDIVEKMEENIPIFIENDKSLPMPSLLFETKKTSDIFESSELVDQIDDEILYKLKDIKNQEIEKYKNDYINLNKDDNNKMRIFFEQNVESFLNLDSNDINRNKKLKNIISSIEVCLKCEKDLIYADTKKIEILFDKLLSNIDNYTNKEISYRKYVKEDKEINSSSSYLDEYGNENNINDDEEDELIAPKLESNENVKKNSQKNRQKNKKKSNLKNSQKNNSNDEKTNTNNINDIIYGNYNILLYLLLLNFTSFKNYIDIEEINKHILINLKTNFKNVIIKLCENEIKNKIVQFYNIHEQFLIQLIWAYEKVLLYIYDIYIYIEKYDTVLINLLDLCLITFQANYNIQIIILHSINLLLKVFNTNQSKNMKKYILDNLIINISTIDFKYNKINFKNSHTNSTYIHLSIFLIIKIAESFSFYYGDVKNKFILQQKSKQIKIQNKLDKKYDKNKPNKLKNGKNREKIYSLSSHDYSSLNEKGEDEDDDDDEDYNFSDEYSRGKKGKQNNKKLKLNKKKVKTTETNDVKHSSSSSDDSLNFSIFTSENDSENFQSDIFIEKKIASKPRNSNKVSKLRKGKNAYTNNSKHLHKYGERKYSMRKKTKTRSDIYEYDNLNDTHDMKIICHNNNKKNIDTDKIIAPMKYSDNNGQYFDIGYRKESLKTYETKKKSDIANSGNPTEEELNKFMMEQNFKRLNNIINYILIEIIKKILYDDNKNARNTLEVIVLDLIKCCDNPLLSLSTMFVKNLTHLFFDILNKKQENNIKETCLFILRYMIKYIFSIYNYINNSCFHLLYNFNNETKNNKFIKPILNIKNNNNQIDPTQNYLENKPSSSCRKNRKILTSENSNNSRSSYSFSNCTNSTDKKLTQTAKNKKTITKGKNSKKKKQKKNEHNENSEKINISNISNDNGNFKKKDTEKKKYFKCCHEKKEGEQIVRCSICEQLYHITCINKGFNKLDLENDNIYFSLEESKTDETPQEVEENDNNAEHQNGVQKKQKDKDNNRNSGNNDISKFLKYNCDNCKIKNITKSFIIKETQRHNSILNISLKKKKEKKNGFYCLQKFLNNLNIFDIYYYYLLIYIKKENLNENIEKNFNNIYTYILLLYNNFIYTAQASQNSNKTSEDHKLIEIASVKKKKKSQTTRKNKKNRNSQISDISSIMCKDTNTSQDSDQNIFELMGDKNEDTEMKEKEKIVFFKKSNNLLIYEFKNVKENQDTILSLGDMYNFDIYISHVWKLYLYFFFYDFFTISFNQLFYILYENNNKNLRYYSISIINNIINDNYLYLKCKQTQNILLSCLTDNYLKVREYTLCIFYNFCKSFLEVDIIINRTQKSDHNFLLKNRQTEKKDKDIEISEISKKVQNLRSKDIDSVTNNTSENEYEWNRKNNQINLNEYITDEIIESVKRCTKDIKISVRIISVKILKYIIYFNKYIKRYNLLKQDDNTKFEENNQIHKENKINDSITDNVLILNDIIERYASPFDNETMKNTVLEILIEMFFINIFALSNKRNEMEYTQDKVSNISNKNEQNYKSTTLCKSKNYSQNLSNETESDGEYEESFNDHSNSKYVEIEEDVSNLFIHLLFVFKNKHDINIINKMLEYMDKNFKKYEDKLNIIQNVMNKYNADGDDYEEDENDPETKKKEEKKKKLMLKKKKKKNTIKNKRSKQDLKNGNTKYNHNDEDENLDDSNSLDESRSSDDEEKLKNKENNLTKTKNNIYNIYINNYYKYIEILGNKCIKYILEVWIYNLISLFVKTRRNKIHENETKKIIKIFNIIIEIYPNLFIKYLTFFYLYIYNNDVSKDICELLSSVIPHCKLDLHLKLQLKKIKFNNTLLYHNNISISRSYIQLLCSLHTYIFSNFSYFKNYIEDCFIVLYKYKLFFLVNNYILQLNDFVREFYYMSEEDKTAIKHKLCQLYLLKSNEKDEQIMDEKEKHEDPEFQKQIQSQGLEDNDKNSNLQNPENFFLHNIIDITYEDFIFFLNEYKKYIFEIFSISHNDILNINKYTWLVSVIMEFINVNKIILNDVYKDEIDTNIHATLTDETNENKNSINNYSNDKNIKYIKLSDLSKNVQIYTNGILYFEFMHNKQMDYIKKWNILKLKKEIILEIINKKFNINKIESFADICNYKFYDVVLVLKKLLIDLFYISNDIKCKSFFLLCLSKILSNYHNSHYINDLNLRNLFFFCINSQNPSLQKNFLYILLQLIKTYEHFFNNKDNLFYTHSLENNDNLPNLSNKNKKVLELVENADPNCKIKRKQANVKRNNKDNHYKKEKQSSQADKSQSQSYEKESNSSAMFANTDYKSNENNQHNHISKGRNKINCKNNTMKIETSIDDDDEIETQIGDDDDAYDAENGDLNKSRTEHFANKKKNIQKKNKQTEIANKRESIRNGEDNSWNENENKFDQQTDTPKNKNNMHVLLLASLFTQKIVEILKINKFFYLDCSQEELNHIKNLGVQILNHLYREGFIQSTSICPTIFPLCFSSDIKLKLQGQKVINFIMEKENYNFLNNLSECLQGLLFYIIENYYIQNRKQNCSNNEEYKNIDNMNQFFLFSQMEPIFFKALLDIYEKLETKKLKIMFLKIILKQIENTSHSVLYEKVINFVRFMNQKYAQYNQTDPQNISQWKQNDNIYTEMYSKNGAIQICSIKDIYCYISKNYLPKDRQRISNDSEENLSDENFDTSENDENDDGNENENSHGLRKKPNVRKNKRNGSNKILNSKESINFESVTADSTTNYENSCDKDTEKNIYIKIKKKYNNILEEHTIIDEYTIVNYFLFLYLQMLTYLISYINFSTYNEIAILIHDINRVYSITSSTINIGNDADKVKPEDFHFLDEHIKQIANEDDNIREKEMLNTPYIASNLNKVKCFIIVVLGNLVTNLMGNYNLGADRLSDLIDDNNLKENKIDEEKREEKKSNFNYYDYIYECIDIYMGNSTEIVNKYSKHNLNTYEMNNDYLNKLINEGKNNKILQKKRKNRVGKKTKVNNEEE